MNCPNCGHIASPQNKFCPNCGGALPQFAQTTAFSQSVPAKAPVKKHGCWYWGVIIVVVGAIVIACLGALAGQRSGGTSTVASTTRATVTVNVPTSTPIFTPRPAVTRTVTPTQLISTTLTPTRTPLPTFAPWPTQKPIPTSKPTTPTPTPSCASLANRSLTYQVVDKSPGKYDNETVLWNGTVFNIQETDEGTALQAYYGDTYDAFVVVYYGSLPNVYKDTKVTVCGSLEGTFDGTNAFGATISQPEIWAEYVNVR